MATFKKLTLGGTSSGSSVGVITITADQMAGESYTDIVFTDEQKRVFSNHDTVAIDVSNITGVTTLIYLELVQDVASERVFTSTPVINGDSDVHYTEVTYDSTQNTVYIRELYAHGVRANVNTNTNVQDLVSIVIGGSTYVIPSGLPTVTASDAGKILTVNASGQWEAAAIPNAEDTNF